MDHEFSAAWLKGLPLEALLLCVCINPGFAQDDVSAGQLAFNNACRTCHVTDKGDNRLGPNLHAIIGREAGSAQNYRYSSALSSADFKWTQQNLDAFIANPDTVVPGHNMKPYGGITDAEERRKIVAYLNAQSGGDGG